MPQNHDQERRVSDSFDPKDVMQVAMRITQLGGSVQNLQMQFAQSQQALGTAMQGLQVELHAAVNKLGEITVLAERQGQDNASIARVWQAIETANERTNRIEKRFNTWGGIAIGLSLMSSVLAGSYAWFGRQYVENTGAALRSSREQAEAANVRLDHRLDRIEIHLAGGERPFNRD